VSSSGSEPVAPWDTTFNRALNRTKNLEPVAKPTSGGRVPGFGATSWTTYYGAAPKGRKAESQEVKALREQVQAFPGVVEDAVTRAVTAATSQMASQFMTMLPNYLERYKSWERSGKKGPPPVPDVTIGSAQSENMPRQDALVTPATTLPVAPVLVDTPPAPEVAAAKEPTRATVAPPSGSHSALGPRLASPLAAFDALEVITKSLRIERSWEASSTTLTPDLHVFRRKTLLAP
jgi:hypothetical protein